MAKKKIKASITVVKFTAEDGTAMIMSDLFLPTNEAKKHGITPDTCLYSWLGIEWHVPLTPQRSDCSPHLVEDGISWSTSCPEASWGQYQEDIVGVYPVKWTTNGVLRLDFDRARKENWQSLHLYKFEATRILHTTGYVYARSENEAKALIADAPPENHHIIGKFPSLTKWENEGWHVDLVPTPSYEPKACDTVLGIVKE